MATYFFLSLQENDVTSCKPWDWWHAEDFKQQVGLQFERHKLIQWFYTQKYATQLIVFYVKDNKWMYMLILKIANLEIGIQYQYVIFISKWTWENMIGAWIQK